MFSDRNYNKRFSSYTAGNYAVPTIIFVNVVFFLLQQLNVTRVGAYSYSSITYSLALIPYSVSSNYEIWRVFTYMFLHGGFWHLLLNMWGVYLFGSMLEQYMGSKKFLLLYLISGLFAGIFWMAFNWNSMVVCIGASGALFGILTGAALLFPNSMIMLLIPPIPLKLRTFAIIYALIETFSAVSGFDGQVAHLAHIGGLVGGYLVMRIMYPGEVYDIFKFLKISNIRRQPKNFSGKASKSWKITGVSPSKIDEILDKISRNGINSLTEEEITALKQARDNIRSNK